MPEYFYYPKFRSTFVACCETPLNSAMILSFAERHSVPRPIVPLRNFHDAVLRV